MLAKLIVDNLGGLFFFLLHKVNYAYTYLPHLWRHCTSAGGKLTKGLCRGLMERHPEVTSVVFVSSWKRRNWITKTKWSCCKSSWSEVAERKEAKKKAQQEKHAERQRKLVENAAAVAGGAVLARKRKANDDGNERFCKCNQPYDEVRAMLGCEYKGNKICNYNGWTHPECFKMSETAIAEVESNGEWCCPCWINH